MHKCVVCNHTLIGIIFYIGNNKLYAYEVASSCNKLTIFIGSPPTDSQNMCAFCGLLFIFSLLLISVAVSKMLRLLTGFAGLLPVIFVFFDVSC